MLREFTWCIDAGATQETQLVTNTVVFGDGYEQVSSFGINNVRTSWQASRKGYALVVNEIYNFLIDHKGITPFTMTINGQIRSYRTDGSITKSHLGGDVWQVSFTLKQVFI